MLAAIPAGYQALVVDNDSTDDTDDVAAVREGCRPASRFAQATQAAGL